MKSFHHPLLFILINFNYYIITNQAFVILPSSTTSTTSTIISTKEQVKSISREKRHDILAIAPLYSKSKDDDDNDDDDEEDMDIDLSDRDWRAFRAQLVMESSSSSSNSNDNQEEEEAGIESTTNTSSYSSNSSIEYNDDLYGIGSLFTDPSSTKLSKSTSSQKTTSTTPMKTSNFTPLQPSQWAYDSGNVIEKGAVILGGVEQDYGFGLRQQYFHKVVILVIDHDNRFTKGIILNRPSDLILIDDDDDDDDDGGGGSSSSTNSSKQQWRVWFGGDVQGLDAIMPEVICLHSISTGNKDEDEQINEVSNIVMKDIKWTSFEDAKMLVKKGLAKTNDFWVFAGYAGWGPNQLMGELERKSWYMAATDSQTLLKELAKQSALTDPRDAGLDTWELLMNLIGRGMTAEESSGDFEDLMLKEWARENLLSLEAGGNAGTRMQSSIVAKTGKSLASAFMETLMNKKQPEKIDDTPTPSSRSRSLVGSLLRAGSTERSPFLLEKQEFHKSVVLVIGDESEISVGMILNQPSTKAIEMVLVDKITSEKRSLDIPIRFGGQYSIQGQSPIMWFHNNRDLKDMMIGTPIKPVNGIWKCTADDAARAIESGKAKPSDFLITSGISVWIKGGKGNIGLQGAIDKGHFEIIPPSKYPSVWKKLLGQKEVLTKLNLVQNISKGHEAWEEGGDSTAASSSNVDDDDDVITEGIGEGFDEVNDSYVHNSDVRLSKLSDDALRSCK
jgi:putative AlgH/UPF0301 family transcriptional regulator